MTSSPSGCRVLVTRAAHQAGKLSDALRALGLEPVEVPVLEIRPPESFAAVDAALCNLTASSELALNAGCNLTASSELVEDIGCLRSLAFGDRGCHEPHPHYDWLILTSANTVYSITSRAAALSLTLANYEGQVAAIGEATAIAAREAGLTISLIPESYVAESLVASLKDQVAGKCILLARAAVARDIIPDALRAAGAEVTVVDAYRNIIPDAAPAQLRRALEQGIDAVTFTSSSSVTNLAAVANQAGIHFPFANISAISIGPITTQTLWEHNWPPAAEATVSDIPGLAAAVAKLLN